MGQSALTARFLCQDDAYHLWSGLRSTAMMINNSIALIGLDMLYDQLHHKRSADIHLLNATCCLRNLRVLGLRGLQRLSFRHPKKCRHPELLYHVRHGDSCVTVEKPLDLPCTNSNPVDKPTDLLVLFERLV